MSEQLVLECRNLGRTYRDGDLEVEVLRDINFSLPSAAKVAVVGASGSGKSTLLNLLGGLDLPSTGQVLMLGRDLAQLGEAERCVMRNAQLGFVYQFHHLLGEFSACENVAMPLLIAGESNSAALKQAAELLDQVGMSHRLQHRPAQLSGGERQRVAIARALVMKPACVLMDEPTGNLDPGASEQVLGLIDSLKRDITASFIVVTHDAGIASRMDSVYELKASGLHLLEPGLAR
jgi:lipoprotein-releasing system ATP-binding protein